MYEEGGPVTERGGKGLRGTWRSNWVRFWVWVRTDSSVFTEAMLAGWSLVVAIFMGLLASLSGQYDPSATLKWGLTVIFLLATGVMGLHITYRWNKWNRHQP